VKTLRGLPPFLPFSLAAAALASVRVLPPLRPRATAGGDAITTVANSRANRSHSRLARSGSGGGCWCRRMRRFASATGLCLTADRQRGIAHRLPVTVGRDRAIDVGADLVVRSAAQRLVFGHFRAEIVSREAVDLAAGALSLRQHRGESGSVAGEAGAELVGRELCEEACLIRHG
jgi:hypothetical protein